MPGIQYGLGVETDQVMVRYQDTANGPQLKRPVISVQDFVQFIKERMKRFKITDPDELVIMCSSSMDFPEDSTDNPATIKLARELRG